MTYRHLLTFSVGVDTFRIALSHYLSTHAYGVVVPSDLWDAVSAEASIDVGSLMHGWVYSEGYPLVTVDTQTSPVRVSQERFFATVNASTSNDVLWWVPLTFFTSADPAVLHTGVLAVCVL